MFAGCSITLRMDDGACRGCRRAPVPAAVTLNRCCYSVKIRSLVKMSHGLGIMRLKSQLYIFK